MSVGCLDGAPAVGAFRLALHADTALLAFIAIASADTGTFSGPVVANAVDAQVLIAGASTSGFAEGAWFVVSFVKRGSGAARTPALDVIELTDLHGSDIRSAMRATPVLPRGPGGGAP